MQQVYRVLIVVDVRQHVCPAQEVAVDPHQIKLPVMYVSDLALEAALAAALVVAVRVHRGALAAVAVVQHAVAVVLILVVHVHMVAQAVEAAMGVATLHVMVAAIHHVMEAVKVVAMVNVPLVMDAALAVDATVLVALVAIKHVMPAITLKYKRGWF